MKRKVIHLLCHTAPYAKEHIYYGWPARTARYMKKFSEDFEHQCFYSVTTIKKEEIWKKDGITYRLFPAWTANKALESFFGIVLSWPLLSALREEVKNPDTILHIQGERGFLIWQAIQLAKKNPIFIQFHGYRTPKILVPLERLFITPFERYFFRYVRHFFVCMKYRIPYLIQQCKVDSSKISHQNLGVDYRLFKPADIRRTRKKLGLPQMKTIFLYVGRFDRVKGVREIINAYGTAKKNNKVYLILIGGEKNNEYYRYAKQNADLVMERIDHERLVSYFNASDAYCMLCPPEKALTSGMGVAPCEALACDKPILSSNLFEAPRKIQDKIGMLIRNQDDMEKAMVSIAQKKKKFQRIRRLTEPYYSWDHIIRKTLELYNKS